MVNVFKRKDAEAKKKRNMANSKEENNVAEKWDRRSRKYRDA